jgi:hypothetical protein
VLGQHKSKYIVPLWFQVKALPSISQGLQFVATFKPEKKNVQTTVGYVLIDAQKNIISVSSS